jgi:hypothetical protein
MFFALPYDVNIKTALWIPVMVYLGILGTVFVLRAKKVSSELIVQKARLNAISLIFYMYIGVRIFFTLSDYERIRPDYPSAGDSDLYFRFVTIAYICAILAFIRMIYIFEKFIFKRTKFLMTIMFIFLLVFNVVLLFFPNFLENWRFINYIPLYVEIAILMLVYTYLSFKTSKELRIISIVSLLGLFFMAAAALLESEFISATGLFVPYYSPPVFAFGATIFSFGQRSVKTEELDESTKILVENVLLSRPPKITEEEVKFYREQTICLVCKGKLGRFDVYLCPDCGGLYCKNCALALAQIENVCWVCDEPIDESKPIKLTDEKEKETLIEAEIHKK